MMHSEHRDGRGEGYPMQRYANLVYGLALVTALASCTRTYRVRTVDLDRAKTIVKKRHPETVIMPAQRASGTDTYLRMASIDMASIRVEQKEEWTTVEATDYSGPLTYSGISLTALGLIVGVVSIVSATQSSSDGYSDPSVGIGILGSVVGGGLALIGLPMMITGLVMDSHEADAPSPSKWPSASSARYGLSLTFPLP